MARKLCICCKIRTAQTGTGPGVDESDFDDQCNYCYTEGGWENSHSDHNHEEKPQAGCWICEPELNLAQHAPAKGTRKGHHSPRRQQIDHKACSHPQTPKARRECRKAHWKAVAAGTAEGVAPRMSKGLPLAAAPAAEPFTWVEKAVTWVGASGKALGGIVTKDLGDGKVLVRSTKGTPVRVAVEKLRLA